MNERKINGHLWEVYLNLEEMIQTCAIDMILYANREILEILRKVCA